MKVKAKRVFTALDEHVDLQEGDVLECTPERAEYLIGIGFVEKVEPTSRKADKDAEQ